MIIDGGDLPPYIKAWSLLGHINGPTFDAQRSALKFMSIQQLSSIYHPSTPGSGPIQQLPIAAAYPNHSNSISNTLHTNVSCNTKTLGPFSRNNTKHQDNGLSAGEIPPICGSAPSQGKTDLKGQKGEPAIGGTGMERGNGNNKSLYGVLPPAINGVDKKLEETPLMACSHKMPISPSCSKGSNTPPSQPLSTSRRKRQKISPPVSVNLQNEALFTLTLAFRGVHRVTPY